MLYAVMMYDATGNPRRFSCLAANILSTSPCFASHFVLDTIAV